MAVLAFMIVASNRPINKPKLYNTIIANMPKNIAIITIPKIKYSFGNADILFINSFIATPHFNIHTNPKPRISAV